MPNLFQSALTSAMRSSYCSFTCAQVTKKMLTVLLKQL